MKHIVALHWGKDLALVQVNSIAEANGFDRSLDPSALSRYLGTWSLVFLIMLLSRSRLQQMSNQ